MKLKQFRRTKKANIAEVIIPISSIDDIYSDFDLRDITIRHLSNDFINEVITQCIHEDKNEAINVCIVAPKKIKHTLPSMVERVTKKRIKEHFEDKYWEMKYDSRVKAIKGIVFIVLGLICFCATKFVNDGDVNKIIFKIGLDMATFFSWFAMWQGIGILSETKNWHKTLLMKRISNAKIQFEYVKKFGI